MFKEILNNSAILIVLFFVFTQIYRFFSGNTLRIRIIEGLIFGCMAIATMMSPISIGPGVIIDVRSVIISAAAFIGGPITAITVFLIASAYRITIGGVGTFAGVLTIFNVALVGVLFNLYYKHRKIDPGLLSFLMIGVASQLVAIPVMLLLPSEFRMIALKNNAPYMMITYPILSVLLLKMIYTQKEYFTAKVGVKENEKKYMSVLDNIEDGYYEVDLDGNLAFFNNSMCRILGRSQSEMMGMNNRSYMDSVNTKKVFQAFNQVFKTGEPAKAFDWVLTQKNGVKCHVDISISLIRDNDGNATGFRGVVRDITVRKHSEDELFKQKKLFETMFNTIPDGVVITNEHREIQLANKGMETTFGYKPEDLLGKSTEMIYADQEKFNDTGRVVFDKDTEKASDLYVTFYRDKAGKIFPGETFGAKLFDDNDQWIGNLGIMRDISERRQAIDLLTRTEKDVKNLVRNIADAILAIDPDGNVLLVNTAAELLLGHPAAELLNRPFGFPLSGEDESIPAEIEILRKDNSIRSAEMKTSKTTWEGKAAVLISLRDITERKEVEIEKEIMKEQLLQAQKMESIGTLAGGIAHDFNNILSAIIGFTEISIDDLDEESGLYDNLQEVLRAGLRAKDLVSQILTFSRESQTDLKPLKVSLIVAEALRLLRASIPTSIEFHQDISSQAAVKADPTQIHQIIMNLCTNAYHAMRETGGVLTVTSKDIEIDKPLHKRHVIVEPGPWIHLTVSDTGHGIPPEIASRIFDPYFTTKEKGDGTGLGLAVVQGVVEKCEGKISVDSVINKGTTFDIFLPVYASEALPLAQTETAIPTGTGHILVVDDELPIVKMIRQSVESLGYTAETRTSPIEALALLKIHHHRFDLVISDMTMPKMNGLQLADQLHQFCPDKPFILCTGYSDQIKKADFSRLGINALAMKPLVKSDLANHIKKAMDDGNSHFKQCNFIKPGG